MRLCSRWDLLHHKVSCVGCTSPSPSIVGVAVAAGHYALFAMAMNAMKSVRLVLTFLWGLFLALYVISKIHFFTRYDPLGVGSYLREHSTYWVAMAAVAFLIWLIGNWFSKGRQ